LVEGRECLVGTPGRHRTIQRQGDDLALVGREVRKGAQGTFHRFICEVGDDLARRIEQSLERVDLDLAAGGHEGMSRNCVDGVNDPASYGSPLLFGAADLYDGSPPAGAVTALADRPAAGADCFSGWSRSVSSPTLVHPRWSSRRSRSGRPATDAGSKSSCSEASWSITMPPSVTPRATRATTASGVRLRMPSRPRVDQPTTIIPARRTPRVVVMLVWPSGGRKKRGRTPVASSTACAARRSSSCTRQGMRKACNRSWRSPGTPLLLPASMYSPP